MFGEYIPSNSGTVDTLTLNDGQQIQVSAVDGDTPYIVSRSNGNKSSKIARKQKIAQYFDNSRSNPRRDEYGYEEGHRCIYLDEDGNCADHLYAQGQQQARQERQERQEQARQERQRQQAQRDRVARGRQIRDSRSSKGQGSQQSRQSRGSQPNRFSRSSGSQMPKRYLNRPSQMDYGYGYSGGYGYGGGYGMDTSKMSIQERRRMMRGF